ncbi:PAPA-1-like conserved region-domain-containing protein [Mycena vulgaris]|nr:PAPA-1-like conserved region-domain-containing protein [Mycena vulgaris]
MAIASEESEVDIEVEAMENTSEEEEEPFEDEEVGEDELEEDESDREQSQPSTGLGRAGPLKIKLKLGAQPGAAESKAPARRFARAKNEDIESEDSDSEDSEANAYAPGPSSGRQLTARQAVLASAVDPSHVALDSAPSSSKKAQFTPTEVALRKEENARKRKNMIEKKLEDEKAETIHRLLKKQSRPKNKRTTAGHSDEDEMDEDAGDAAAAPAGEPLVPMYRWVSTSRKPAAADDNDSMPVDSGADPSASLSISFSIPEAFLPAADEDEKHVVIQLAAVAPPPAGCAVAGCEGKRKYRAVGKAWGVGACGLGHLKVLEGRA